MDPVLKANLSSRDLWLRLLYMILFGITYSIAELLVVCTSIFQFLTILVTGKANRPMLEFGMNLSLYVQEVFEYQTFNTEEKPFPFAPWPEEPGGGEAWRGEEEPQDLSGAEVPPDTEPVPQDVQAGPGSPSGPADERERGGGV